MRSLYDNVTVNTSIEPQSVTTTTTQTGTAIDTMGYSTGMLRVRVGIADASVATLGVVLQESDSSTALFTVALDNTGAAIGGTTNGLVTANSIIARIEGLGVQRKRYLRLVSNSTITGTSVPIFGEILLGRGYTKPANTAVSNT